MEHATCTTNSTDSTSSGNEWPAPSRKLVVVEQYAARREHRYSRKGASVRGVAAPISERHRTVATPAAACAASLPPLPQFVAPGVTTRRQAAAAAEDDQLLGDAVPDDDNDDLSSILAGDDDDAARGEKKSAGPNTTTTGRDSRERRRRRNAIACSDLLSRRGKFNRDSASSLSQ